MPSSVVTVTSLPSSSVVVTGVISSSQKPLVSDFSARCWERAANSSISWRLTFSYSATFSAVWPMAM